MWFKSYALLLSVPITFIHSDPSEKTNPDSIFLEDIAIHYSQNISPMLLSPACQLRLIKEPLGDSYFTFLGMPFTACLERIKHKQRPVINLRGIIRKASGSLQKSP